MAGTGPQTESNSTCLNGGLTLTAASQTISSSVLSMMAHAAFLSQVHREANGCAALRPMFGDPGKAQPGVQDLVRCGPS